MRAAPSRCSEGPKKQRWFHGSPATQMKNNATSMQKPLAEHISTHKYFNLIIINYIFGFTKRPVYSATYCGVAYEDVLKCRLRLQQTDQIPRMCRSGTSGWRRLPGQNSAHG